MWDLAATQPSCFSDSLTGTVIVPVVYMKIMFFANYTLSGKCQKQPCRQPPPLTSYILVKRIPAEAKERVFS